jgi:hypothetical protein
MHKSRKNILLIVRRHAGEVDWILPLLYRFDKKINLVTIFENHSSFRSLSSNKKLFNLWKLRCNKYVIKDKTDNFAWKLLHKVLVLSKIKNLLDISKIEEFILEKTFDFQKFLKKIKVTEFKAVFVTNINLSYLPTIIKKKNPNTLIVRYPESTWIFPPRSNILSNQNKQKIYSVTGDLFLYANKDNQKFLLDDKTSNISKNRTLICGFPRYEKWWVKKFIGKKIKKDSTFKILVALRHPNKHNFQISSYKYIVKSIIETAAKFKNCKVVFKLHPHNADYKLLRDTLSIFDKKIWSIRKEHLMVLAHSSDLCITIMTSGCFDCLALNKPTVEFFRLQYELDNSPTALKNSTHYIFDKKTNKWKSTFQYFGFVENVQKQKELENLAKLVFFQKKKYIWKKKINNYNKFLKSKYDSKEISKIILKNFN